jgi:hypothetical protein
VAVRVRSGLRLDANVTFKGDWIEEHPRIIVVDGLPVLVTPGSTEDMLAMLLAGPVTEAIRGLIADEPWREDAVVPVEFSEVEDVWGEAFASAPSAANEIDAILAPFAGQNREVAASFYEDRRRSVHRLVAENYATIKIVAEYLYNFEVLTGDPFAALLAAPTADGLDAMYAVLRGVS